MVGLSHIHHRACLKVILLGYAISKYCSLLRRNFWQFWPIGSSGGHEGRFSRDLLPACSAGGPYEQFWHRQGCQSPPKHVKIPIKRQQSSSAHPPVWVPCEACPVPPPPLYQRWPWETVHHWVDLCPQSSAVLTGHLCPDWILENDQVMCTVFIFWSDPCAIGALNQKMMH